MLGKFIKAAAFMGVLSTIIYVAGNILRLKIYEADTWKIFYEQPENSIDVLALGSSHVFGSVNPAILWEDYGITAFDLCASGSNTTTEYYYLKEALRTQRPKVVLVGVGLDFAEDEKEVSAETAYMWTGGMRMSRIKAELLDYIAPSHKLDVMAGIPLSHSRVDELEKRDFLPYRGEVYHRGYKGSRIFWGTRMEEYDVREYPYSEKIGEIPDRTEEMLCRMIQLSKEEDFELIFYVSPALRDKETWEGVNYIEKMAAKQGIGFLNCYKENGQIGFDYENDLCDKKHVNYIGNIKTTKYIGKILTKQYDLTDHRGEEEGETWEQCAADYNSMLEDYRLVNTEEPGIFLELADKEYYTGVLLIGEGLYGNLSAVERERLRAMGLSEEAMKSGGTFVLQNSGGGIRNQKSWSWEGIPFR